MLVLVIAMQLDVLRKQEMQRQQKAVRARQLGERQDVQVCGPFEAAMYTAVSLNTSHTHHSSVARLTVGASARLLTEGKITDLTAVPVATVNMVNAC
jgi:hypothetical protein